MLASPRSTITGGSLASSSNLSSRPVCFLPSDRTELPTSAGETPPPGEDPLDRDLDRDWDLERDLDWDLVVGPLLLLPPLPRSGEMEVSRDRRRLRWSPPLEIPCLPLEVDLDRLAVSSCLCPCLFCLRVVVAVGLDAFRLYRLLSVRGGVRFLVDTAVVGGCLLTGERDAESMEVAAPSPAAGEELVTGAKIVSSLTCTSQTPVLPNLAASTSNSM